MTDYRTVFENNYFGHKFGEMNFFDTTFHDIIELDFLLGKVDHAEINIK
jgi:hypothetical protein